MGSSISAQGGLANADPLKIAGAGLIGGAIGAISGAISFGFAQIGQVIGQSIGMALSNLPVLTTVMTKATVTAFATAGWVAGGITGGFIGTIGINIIASDFLGKKFNFKEFLKNESPGWTFDFLKWLIQQF